MIMCSDNFVEWMSIISSGNHPFRKKSILPCTLFHSLPGARKVKKKIPNSLYCRVLSLVMNKIFSKRLHNRCKIVFVKYYKS